MPKRQPRKVAIKSKPDFLKPIDVTVFGGPEDPCFGKHYDVNAKECGECGDSELCIIALAHSAKLQRAEIEAKTPLKDLENFKPHPSSERAIQRYILKKKDSGLSIPRIVKRVAKRYNKSEEEAKKLVKNLIKE